MRKKKRRNSHQLLPTFRTMVENLVFSQTMQMLALWSGTQTAASSPDGFEPAIVV